MGANDDTNLNSYDLWSKKFGIPSYIAVMTRNRSRQLKTQDSTLASLGPKEIVKRLVPPSKNSGLNITTNRYCMYFCRACIIVFNAFALTLVGTLQQMPDICI